MSWRQDGRMYLVLFLCGLFGFGLVAGARLSQQSADPHFVYQADAWLHGRLAIDPPPQKGDDWAFVDKYELDDGSVVRGRRLSTRATFKIAGGNEIPRDRLRKRLDRTYYVSFPPTPALLMLPSALLSGRQGNDVVPTVLLASLILPLAFATLRRMASAGLSEREQGEDIGLTFAFAFGTVFYFCAVQGRVWFTAHVVGAALAWAYLYSSIEAKRPLLAGLCLGLATLARVPLAFAFVFFLFEAWRISAGDRKLFLRRVAVFAAPVVTIALIAMAYNLARWDSATEFGHSYLNVRQQQQIEAHGLFSFDYLARNLKVVFALFPSLKSSPPYVQFSGHGMAIWVSSPFLLWAFWPKNRTPLHVPLWITAGLVALPPLFYQNTGWFQFGYRFSVDYLPFLVVLIGLRKLPLRHLAAAAFVFAMLLNMFGAITFGRHHQYYRTDAAAYRSIR